MITVNRNTLYQIPSPVLYFEINEEFEHGILKIKQRTLENEDAWYYSYFIDIYPNNIDNIQKLLSGEQEFSLCSREMKKDDEYNKNKLFIILQKNDINTMINNLNMVLSTIDY